MSHGFSLDLRHSQSPRSTTVSCGGYEPFLPFAVPRCLSGRTASTSAASKPTYGIHGWGATPRTVVRSAVEVQEGSAQPLTPRQRRLAQQRRKWEQEQRQQKEQKQRRHGPSAKAAPAQPAKPPTVGSTPPAVDTPRSHAGKPAQAAEAAADRPGTTPTPPPTSPERCQPVGAPSSASTSSPAGQRRPDATVSTAPTPHASLPSLFLAGPLPPKSLDLHSLSNQQLASLARSWAEELVGTALQHTANPASATAARPITATTAATVADAASTDRDSIVLPSLESGGKSLSGGHGSEVAKAAGQGHLAGAAAGAGTALPPAVHARLGLLTEAVTARLARGGLGQQELVDLVWAVAHYDRDRALRDLYPAMDVPFRVIPRFMPELRLEDFMSEVELRRDVIYLDDGSRAVEESRLTGWQSDIGATFKYSGKEMQPQAGGMTPAVRKLRDALQALTGVWYDSVLINYYADGKCGMRYHVDPLYDRWTPDTAVVSLGDTRTFIFRAISDYGSRWLYRVRNGDVVHMFGDCQERLQHCVRVERHASDAGPRMSLVFKQRMAGPDGRYLLP